MRVCIAGALLFVVSGLRELRHPLGAKRPSIPTEERKPAWRRACLAYRAWRQAGASDQEAHEAAVAAVQSVLPLSWKEASAEAVNAVAYAAKYHPEWFWRGAQHAAAAASTHAREVPAAPA